MSQLKFTRKRASQSFNKRRRIYASGVALTWFGLGLGILGCELPKDSKLSQESQKDLPGSCYVESFQRQVPAHAGALDLLFVADTSASLVDERGQIANGIDHFVSQLPAGLDFQVAVLPAHGSLGSNGGRISKYKNNPYVMSSQTMSLSQIRKSLNENLMNAPTDHYADGGEEGLYSLYHSMDNRNLTSNQAHGFFRPNAALAVVFISDENDICAEYPAGVKRVPDPENLELPAKARDCKGITPQSVLDRLKQLQGNRPLIVSGIVYSDLKTVPKVKDAQDEYGYGYMDLITLGGGLAVDIAKRDYDTGLSQIGRFTSDRLKATVDFKLGHQPVDASTIVASLVTPGICKGQEVDLGKSGEQGDSDDHDDKGSKSCDKDSGKSEDDSSQSISCKDLSRRVTEVTFDAVLNQVHLLDDHAVEPVLEVSYCLVKPSPSPSASPSVSPSASPSPSVTPSPSPSVSPSVTPVPTPSVSPSVTPVPSPSVTAAPSPSPSPTVTVVPSPSPTPSATVEPSPSPTVTVVPSPSPSPTATVEPSPSPTVTVVPSPSPSPTATVEPSPSPTVTVVPSPSPSPTVTVVPSPSPSPTVTVVPSPSPSPTVTVLPSPSPSPTATVVPSPSPTATVVPSPSPSPTTPPCTGPFCGGGGLGS